MGTCTQQAEAGGDSYLIGRGGQKLIPDRQRQMGRHIQQAKIDGDMYPTGRDRRGHEPNTKGRQMGSKQAEAGGGLHPTGGDRWGHILNRQRQKGTRLNRHPTRDMCPTGEDRCSSSGDRDRNPTTEANAQQRETARVSEAQADRQIPRRDMQVGKMHRYPESQTLDSRADLWVLFRLPQGGERGKGPITCKHPHVGGQTSICGRTVSVSLGFSSQARGRA